MVIVKEEITEDVKDVLCEVGGEIIQMICNVAKEHRLRPQEVQFLLDSLVTSFVKLQLKGDLND